MTDDDAKQTDEQTDESSKKNKDGRVTDAETAFEEYTHTLDAGRRAPGGDPPW